MDKLTLFLIPMLILQCSCSFDLCGKLESYERWKKDDRFLKAKWDRDNKTHELSFTGREKEKNTTFIFRYRNKNNKTWFAIHLAEDQKYFLAADNNGRGLVVKKLLDATGNQTRMGNYYFTTKRISSPLTKKKDANYHHAIRSLWKEKSRAIKSDNSGLISLGIVDDTDTASWVGFKSTGSGKCSK